jgi:hypothetical protein
MREITTHHDGHGLNESITIEADEPGPGGASHEYRLIIDQPQGVEWFDVAHVRFQKGPRNVNGSTPGVTELAVLAILRDRLESFQAGEYACFENEEALNFINGAMTLMKDRADKRAARGVLGTYQK